MVWRCTYPVFCEMSLGCVCPIFFSWLAWDSGLRGRTQRSSIIVIMYHQHNLCLLTLTLTTWLRPSLPGFSTVKGCFLLFPYPTLQKEVGLRHVLEGRASLRMLAATGLSVPSHCLLLLPQARVGLPPNPTCASGHKNHSPWHPYLPGPSAHTSALPQPDHPYIRDL